MTTVGTENICSQIDFELSMNPFSDDETDYIEAYVYVIPEDREQTLYLDEEFEIEGRYIIGDPEVLEIPFIVNTYMVGTHTKPSIEVLSITPPIPNVNFEATIEQTVIARCIARSDDPANAEISPSVGRDVRFEFEIFQRDPEDAVTARHSGADGSVPNVTSVNHGNYQYISFDTPLDEDDNEVGVDARVVVDTIDSEGNTTRVGQSTETIPVGDNDFEIDYDYLNELVMASGGEMSRTQDAVVTVQLKPDIFGTAFNRDDVVLRFLFPFTPRPDIMENSLRVEAQLKYRLQGGLTVPYLALEFYAVAARQEDIDWFEYRIRRWTQFPSQDPDNPFPQPDPPFSGWIDVFVRTRGRFQDGSRSDIERTEFGEYLGPWSVHGDTTPSIFEYATGYIVEARVVNRIGDEIRRSGAVVFNLVTPSQ